MNKATITLLHINGWVAVLIGSFIVLDPVSMLGPYGLQSDLSAGLLSELRAPGGLLLVCGLMIARSTLCSTLTEQGLQLSALVYGGYGGTRLLGIAIDGLPPLEIMAATGIELTLFGLSILVLQKHLKNSGNSSGSQENYRIERDRLKALG